MKLNDTQKAKITRFLNDEQMSESVKEVLLNSFLKPRPNSDIYVLAASKIAIDLLGDAFKDLDKFRNETETEPKKGVQVGL